MSGFLFPELGVPPLWSGGPTPSSQYSFPMRPNPATFHGPTTHSQYPTTTGTSVFALKYKDGVIFAADALGSYGSLARFPEMKRLYVANKTTIIGFSGDIADFQYLEQVIERRQREEDAAGGGISLRPKAMHTWLTSLMYKRRSKIDPLWLNLVVGGNDNGTPFLGGVDVLGAAWKEGYIATGIGAEFVPAIVHDEIERLGGTDNISLEEAKELIKKMVKVCYLRDCNASAKFFMAYTDKEGAKEEGPFMIDSDWTIARGIVGFE